MLFTEYLMKKESEWIHSQSRSKLIVKCPNVLMSFLLYQIIFVFCHKMSDDPLTIIKVVSLKQKNNKTTITFNKFV